MGANVFDMRFLSFMPEIDLLAVMAANDDVDRFTESLQSYIDMGPGFITFMKDPVNHRNAIEFASGVAVLKNLLASIGCKSLMLDVAHLEGAIKNRKVDLRNELLEKLPKDIEKFREKLKALPRVEPVAKKISETLEIETEAEATRKKSILVIDDAADCLNSVEAVLETWFNVYSLIKSETYEKLLQKIMVDLFILDVEMPGMDGYQVLEGLRKMPAYKDTPVMLLTSYATQGNLKMAMDVGIKGFVRKPFVGDTLVTKVCEAIASSRPRVYTKSIG